MDNDAGRRGASVRLDGVSRYYDSVAAIRDVYLDVAPGEFVTLLGPSGSGKSTTLNIVAGFDRANRGEVLVDDNPIGTIPAHRRNIGMVFQHYALFPHLTVAQNIAYPLEERRLPKAEIRQRTIQSMSLVRLEGYADRRIAQISGGQQQRVALARAIIFSPRVLLMDEPLGALDKKLREQLQQEFKALHTRIGATILFVTHDQEEALSLSDRIAVFNNGRIEQIGTPKDLWQRPVTPFVADFLGESNLIPGTILGKFLKANESAFKVEKGDYEEGQSATLLIRPEHLRLSRRMSDSVNAANRIAGRVNSASFLGSMRRLSVDCDAAGTFKVNEPAGAFTDFGVGDEVVIGWQVEDSQLLRGVSDNVPSVLDSHSRGVS